MMGETATTLSMKLLCNVAQGRGASIAQDIVSCFAPIIQVYQNTYLTCKVSCNGVNYGIPYWILFLPHVILGRLSMAEIMNINLAIMPSSFGTLWQLMCQKI